MGFAWMVAAGHSLCSPISTTTTGSTGYILRGFSQIERNGISQYPSCVAYARNIYINPQILAFPGSGIGRGGTRNELNGQKREKATKEGKRVRGENGVWVVS